MKNATQGYITIATGSKSYVDMAKFLALSVKANDPKRPIALLTDSSTLIPEDIKALFSHVIEMPKVAGYIGCLNKLRIYDFSPFDESMFIDSDCLIVKDDMDRHWQNFSASDVNLAGDKVTKGHWYNFDIATVISALKIPYMVKMNSGVIYFKKNDQAKSFFTLCNELTKEHKELLSCSHRRVEQLADEPFIGAALGIMQIEPLGYRPEDGSLMITTVGAKDCDFDPIKHVSNIKKPTGYYILNRIWAKSWVKHSPSIAHFVQLKPLKVYKKACDILQASISNKAI